MSTKLYVGNLSFDVTENELREMLSQHGPVNEINVIMDNPNMKWFDFVELT